jgi:hypothetical protein
MMLHQDFTAAQATAHRERLIAEADRRRLLTAARRGRAARRGPAASIAVTNATTSADTATGAAARGAPAGTLAGCGPRVAAPAR